MAHNDQLATSQDVTASDGGFRMPLDVVADGSGQQQEASGGFRVPLDLVADEPAPDDHVADFEAG
jgi:hypothetical protein